MEVKKPLISSLFFVFGSVKYDLATAAGWLRLLDSSKV